MTPRALPLVIFAVDPGTTQSAWMAYDPYEPRHGPIVFGIEPNEHLIARLTAAASGNHLVLEMVASYGMAVGKEVFETVRWIGRFQQAFGADATTLVYRSEVNSHLCHSQKANDSNIRAALIDRFGGSASIKKGGALYGVSKDVWSALAIAVTFADRIAADRTGR
jgi:ABC-type thiamin/hydroxymethylpyrimidine transport system permease subunit